MVDNPDQIAAALLTKLTSGTASGANQVNWGAPPSRAAKIWGNKTPADQPCLFVISMGAHVTREAGYGASKVIYRYTLLAYNRADESTGSVPETPLLNIFTALANVLAPLPGSRQTLGIPTIINDAWIEGEVLMDTGILDAQQMLEIPVLASTGLY